jgi:serine/threonine-protein kinase
VADLRERLEEGLVGRYRLERELGRGGMATVYLAHDIHHDRPVALKVLHPELASTVGPERFQREIHLAARLQHPHILPVHDSGETGGHLWFTMPFVDGESLRDRLRRERQLPMDDAIQIANEVARALDCAHGQGVIHRDIKPENILLTRGGEAVVADFGLARAVGADREHLTNTGLAVGTPAYMSPEQGSGDRELDLRTDLYSLGAVLYEMLAGEPPFTGPTTQAIITRRLTESPRPLRTVRDTVPPGVEAVVMKALARVPADRFTTAGEFAAALARCAAFPDSTSGAPRGAPRGFVTWMSARSKRVVLMVLAVILVAGGAALALHAIHRNTSAAGTGSAGPTRLAVLPFENLGDTSDAYLAEGIASEIRGKLASVPALTVIASTSSNQYRHTTKTPQQIAEELSVQYLLVGHLQWDKEAGSAGRVLVSPELVDAATGATKWQQPFDAALTDVFQVQADIAGRVADALNVALGTSERHALADRPTTNLAAYDAFLQAEALSVGDLWDAATLRRAIRFYEQAVALDSTFAPAWAHLARTRGHLHLVRTPGSRVSAEAVRVAAERARTLAPGRPESQLAWGAYLALVREDFAGALQACETGLKMAPTNVDLLTIAGTMEYLLGRSEAAIQHLRRAQALDPRAVGPPSRLAATLLSLRRWREARHEADRALALAPTNVGMLKTKIETYVGQGDLAGAQATLRAASREMEQAPVVAFVANSNIYWLLDSAQQALLLSLRPAAFDNDRGSWGLALAGTYALRGDQARVRLYADSARLGSEEELRHAPGNPEAHSSLGVALAYLGQRPEAIREGGRGVMLNAKDRFKRPHSEHQLARIYILVGEPEKALDKIEALLKVPYSLSPGWLRIDPTFAPLRGNPRFERLLNRSPAPESG